MRQQGENDISAIVPPSGFEEAASLDQLPPDGLLRVTVGDLDIAMARVDGHVVAVSNLCLRCSGSLASGTVRRRKLTCVRCGWQYDLARGCLAGLPALRIEAHEVRVVDGRLFVATSPPLHAVSRSDAAESARGVTP